MDRHARLSKLEEHFLKAKPGLEKAAHRQYPDLLWKLINIHSRRTAECFFVKPTSLNCLNASETTIEMIQKRQEVRSSLNKGPAFLESGKDDEHKAFISILMHRWLWVGRYRRANSRVRHKVRGDFKKYVDGLKQIIEDAGKTPGSSAAAWQAARKLALKKLGPKKRIFKSPAVQLSLAEWYEKLKKGGSEGGFEGGFSAISRKVTSREANAALAPHTPSMTSWMARRIWKMLHIDCA